MAGFLGKLMSRKDPATKLVERLEAGHRWARQQGIPEVNFEGQMRESNAILRACSFLVHPENRFEILEKSGEEREAYSIRLLGSIRRYKSEMQRAFTMHSYDHKEGAIREAIIYGARRMLCAELSGMVTEDSITCIDHALGLPPVTASLGWSP
jgi:hypothetical protein